MTRSLLATALAATLLTACGDGKPLTSQQSCARLMQEVARNREVLAELAAAAEAYQHILANATDTPPTPTHAKSYRLAMARARVYLYHTTETPTDLISRMQALVGVAPPSPLDIQQQQQASCASTPPYGIPTASANASR